MARIKHIALSTEDPAKTAEFYKKVFGLQELQRKPRDSGADGVWLMQSMPPIDLSYTCRYRSITSN
jgi:catechol 2,3-dioxygenase-like lactoylglutathione lyase family enzyme